MAATATMLNIPIKYVSTTPFMMVKLKDCSISGRNVGYDWINSGKNFRH